ncbi:hypothetical protein BUE93_22140 [Chromobacterium amazonense]|uniref:Toxin co-regulated pilus biosynthesis protein Q C-terminal domain-containing protein n=1 Tax=Chromobacterium amazonense TaxID=1382803 RepID=A0A2S9WYG7_9NEIS|nr:toxin co-regulated pilus biosynthesis Q family protein [Chromobacterium amazonense]PRP68503.1 hypothetical protein BUE93_22140 [Chromobacterium amazonense]
MKLIIAIFVMALLPTLARAGFSVVDSEPVAMAEPLAEPKSIRGGGEMEETLKPLQTEKLVVRAEPAPAESWVVSPADGTIRRALNRWAAQAGWQLHWEAGVDLPVTVSAAFSGSFRDAVQGLFGSLSAAEVNLTALLYNGNRVVRVVETGRRAN